jgi:NitT/TauT family transport system ATP-binding protein
MLNYSENETSETDVPGGGMSPLLSFANVSHVYGSAASPVAALQNINLDVAPGEFVAVVGASGCGKSTLLRIASGLLKPSAGDARFAGETIEGPTSQISMIFQDAVMLPWFTVLENVALPEKIARRNLDAARHRARGMLRAAGLEGFENVYPDMLSGGMRQRAAIVRALITQPSMLLMDEPFGALDAMTRENMNLQLSDTTSDSGCGVLLITHSIAEAVLLADRVVVMSPRPGRIVDEIDIPLPRPRTRATMANPVFTSLCDQLRRHFTVEGRGIE